mmetsp:Transcript_5040/g.10161  ORF Transcript_5040/g.10161 Transcript_5040/m.10161 type:complete len:594 (-) Transcript_5040:122-1903(-)
MLSYFFDGTNEFSSSALPLLEFVPPDKTSNAESHFGRCYSIDDTAMLIDRENSLKKATLPRTPAVQFYGDNRLQKVCHKEQTVTQTSDDHDKQSSSSITSPMPTIRVDHANHRKIARRRKTRLFDLAISSQSPTAPVPSMISKTSDRNNTTSKGNDLELMPPPPLVVTTKIFSSENRYQQNRSNVSIMPKKSCDHVANPVAQPSDTLAISGEYMKQHMMWLQHVNMAADGERKQHLKWLQQMNNIAQQSSIAAGLTQTQFGSSSVDNSFHHTVHEQPQNLIMNQFNTTLLNPTDHGAAKNIFPKASANNPHVKKLLGSAKPSAEELEDRRLCRLARNRESARLSRRRKKEVLQTMGVRVNTLSNEFCEARRLHTLKSEEKLRERRVFLLEELQNSFIEPKNDHKAVQDKFDKISADTGPDCCERRATIDFHWHSLKNLILPPRNRLILWWLLQNKSFFKYGKGCPLDKASSKQVGEKMLNEGKQSHHIEGSWPLLCYELSISFEQEQSILQGIECTKSKSSTSTNKKNVAEIMSTSSHLHKAMRSIQMSTEYISYLKANVGNLTFEQQVKLLLWFQKNGSRCYDLLKNKKAFV